MLKKIEDDNNSNLAKIPTSDEFIVKYSPKACLSKFKAVKTIKQALKQNAGSLSQIKKGYGQEFQKTYLMLWMVDLQEKVGVKNKMHEEVIEECAEFVIEDYYYLNLADINLIFTRAKKGFYGPLYESISMPKILEWFENYANERGELAYSVDISKHEREKNKNPLEKVFGVENLQEKYFDELGKARKTEDYAKVEKMLKSRTAPKDQAKQERIVDLTSKITAHKELIESINGMIGQSENPLMVHQYQGQIDLVKKQMVRNEKELKSINPNFKKVKQ